MIIRIPYILITWTLFVVIKFALVLIGLPAVFLGLMGDGRHRTPKIWRFWGVVEDIPEWWYARAGTTLRAKWWWMAIRNPVQGLRLPPAPQVEQYGHSDMEVSGFRWRYRHTKWRDSFRITWGNARQSGKREIYLGFKIGADVHNTAFSMQFRLF